ncbi:MAG: hypothetical protein FH761_18015 [Firmicutes bacterium]|nr:hypothetical protein [Bacillota bacterium]
MISKETKFLVAFFVISLIIFICISYFISNETIGNSIIWSLITAVTFTLGLVFIDGEKVYSKAVGNTFLIFALIYGGIKIMKITDVKQMLLVYLLINFKHIKGMFSNKKSEI